MNFDCGFLLRIHNAELKISIVYMVMIWFGSLSNLIKITKLTVRHYRAIYTTSMGFFPCMYGTEICQFKIPPIVLFDQIVKYLTHQYYYLYGIEVG